MQGPGQSNPDVSFDLGPQETPVKVTLGKQQALDAAVADSPQVHAPEAPLPAQSGFLSGTGHSLCLDLAFPGEGPIRI